MVTGKPPDQEKPITLYLNVGENKANYVNHKKISK